MAVSLDATVGGASPLSNTYITLAEADAYHDCRLDAVDWTRCATDEDRSKALIQSARLLDTMSFIGCRTATTQARQWPRKGITDLCGCEDEDVSDDVIPQAIKDAQSELALALIMAAENSAEIRKTQSATSTSVTGAVKRTKADVVEIEYFEPTQEQIEAATQTKAAETIPKLVRRLVRHYVNGFGSFSTMNITRA